MKELTQEKIMKQKEREVREIAKLEREHAKPKSKFYLWYLLLIISMVYLVDEIASQIHSQMMSEIKLDLFDPIFGDDQSLSKMNALGMISYLASGVAMLYKPLSDRYGRRIFLFINTLCMGTGLFLMFLCKNIFTYVLAMAFIWFFTPHDMQVVYIMETAPEKHRAKIYASCKCFATLGMLLIPLFRSIFMTDASQWRLVFLVPAIIAFTVSIFAIFFAKESDAFIEQRLHYLHMTDEERALAKRQKDLETAQGGLINALKFVWKHHQLRWLFITSALTSCGIIITMQYGVIAKVNFANSLIANGASVEYATAEAANLVTLMLFMFPVGSAVLQLMCGFVADKIGRKPTGIIMVACTIVSFVLFYVGANNGWNPYLVGLFCGMTIGSYWASGDVMGGMMIAESSPTNLRSSILSAQTVAMACGMGPVFILNMILLEKLGDKAVGIICICLALPGMIAALFLLFAKTHETKGIDLNTVRGDEWDWDKSVE